MTDMRHLKKIRRALATKSLVEFTVEKAVSHGLMVDLYGFQALLPIHQVELGDELPLHAYVGQKLFGHVLPSDFKYLRIKVGRKQFVKDSEALRVQAEAGALQTGSIHKAVVVNYDLHGVDVDLGFAKASIKNKELSWGRDLPSFEVGQKIDVAIVSFDLNKGSVCVSHRAASPNPWSLLSEEDVGLQIKAEVLNTVDYGCFLEWKNGLVGLLHCSNMLGLQPSSFHIGQRLDVTVLSINKEISRVNFQLVSC